MTWVDVFFNPYRRMKRDFSFLEKAGFIFNGISKHNIRPAVIFKKGDQLICVCYDYEIDRFEVTFQLNREDMFGKSMLPVDWNKHFKKTYKSQLSYVRNNLKKQMHLN